MDDVEGRLRFRQKLEIWLAARLLPVKIFKRNLPGTLKYAETEPDPSFRGIDPQQIRQEIKAATRRPWLMRNRRCLREGLLGMRFLRKAGYDPVLKFGIDAKSISSDKLRAHCWVELDGKFLINDDTGKMVVIYSEPQDPIK